MDLNSIEAIEVLVKNITDISTYILIYLVITIKQFKTKITNLEKRFNEHLKMYHKEK